MRSILLVTWFDLRESLRSRQAVALLIIYLLGSMAATGLFVALLSEIENALKDHPCIKEVIVTGDGRKFLGALIQLDFDNAGLWAAERDLPYTTYKSLAQLPEMRALIQGVVDEVNTRFARVENIRRFVILEKELDHDDGELTATQKVRRSIIETKFARELEQIYGPAQGTPGEAHA